MLNFLLNFINLIQSLEKMYLLIILIYLLKFLNLFHLYSLILSSYFFQIFLKNLLNFVHKRYLYWIHTHMEICLYHSSNSSKLFFISFKPNFNPQCLYSGYLNLNLIVAKLEFFQAWIKNYCFSFQHLICIKTSSMNFQNIDLFYLYLFLFTYNCFLLFLHLAKVYS